MPDRLDRYAKMRQRDKAVPGAAQAGFGRSYIGDLKESDDRLTARSQATVAITVRNSRIKVDCVRGLRGKYSSLRIFIVSAPFMTNRNSIQGC